MSRISWFLIFMFLLPACQEANHGDDDATGDDDSTSDDDTADDDDVTGDDDTADDDVTGDDDATGPWFVDATDDWFPEQPCGTGSNQGCYTNFLILADLWEESTLSVLFANGGGYYTSGNAESSVVYRLQDGGYADVTASVFANAESRLRQVAVADVDGNGRLDVVQPGGYGEDLDRLWMQQEGGSFLEEAATRLPPGWMSRAGAAHFADTDDDGDPDLYVTDWGNAPLMAEGNVLALRNEGGVFQAWEGVLPAPLDSGDGNTPIDLDAQDVDGDLDLDLLVNHRNGRSRLFRNDGEGGFTASDEDLPEKQGPYTYNLEACDVDGDGDLDLLADNAAADLGSGHRTQVLVNDGTGHFSDESETRVSGEPNTDDNAVKCADVDDDGDYDLLVASLAHSSEKLLLNGGGGVFQYVDDAFPEIDDPTLGIDVGDINGDGILDVVTGQGEGTPRLNRLYLGTGPSAADTHPPQVRAQGARSAGAGTAVFHVALQDGATSETGQQVREVTVEVSVGGDSQTLPLFFMGGDLYRAQVEGLSSGVSITFQVQGRDRWGHAMIASPLVWIAP